MSEKKFSKIHQKVADVLGMQIPDEITEGEDGIVPVPETNEVALVENAELPDLQQEMQRIEHGQRQTEFLYEHGLTAVQNILLDVPLTPPMYKGRVVETAAELYKAVADLGMHKVEYQIKLVELKLKLAAFTRRKNGDSTPNITGNTIIFNREELIKAFGNYKDDDKDGD